MKKLHLIAIVSLVSLTTIQAQYITDTEDASALLGAYLSPIGESIGAGLNAGWYQTAKPHKLGGFDISLNVNLVKIPDAKFSFDDSDLENFSFDGRTPTLIGDGDGASITYSSPTGIPVEFRMPDQNDLTNKIASIPVPTLNIGIGLIKGIELNARYIPEFELGDFSGTLWGIGLKHDILQWIPLASKLPFDFAIQGALTQFQTTQTLEGSKDVIDLNTLASNFNLIISKKFLMLTGYGSVGYNNSTTTLSASNEFQIGINGYSINIPINDIIFKSNQDLTANLGLRLQLAIMTVNVNHTFSEYPVTSFGLGISFR